MLPWGNAVYLPNMTESPPPAPICRNAAVMLLPSSPCVMPSCIVASPALYAASVMSFAYCRHAMSAADLIVRQPAVTGVARTICADGIA